MNKGKNSDGRLQRLNTFPQRQLEHQNNHKQSSVNQTNVAKCFKVKKVVPSRSCYIYPIPISQIVQMARTLERECEVTRAGSGGKRGGGPTRISLSFLNSRFPRSLEQANLRRESRWFPPRDVFLAARIIFSFANCFFFLFFFFSHRITKNSLAYKHLVCI